MQGKPPRLSRVEMVNQILPGDTNPLGTVFGGKVLQWIDTAGAISAMRHTRQNVVTVSFDRVDFIAPARVGEIMILKAQINYTGRTSLEVGIEVHAENPITGERRLTADALVTFVAIDKKCKPIGVPPLLPETREEKQRFRDGKMRRETRLKNKKS